MPTQATTHLNLFQQIFGTSVSSVIINGAVALILLYFSIKLSYKFVVIPLSELILDPLDFKRLAKRKTIFLELTPPAYSTKTAHATNQFMTLLHNLSSLQTRKEWLLRRKNVISFEVVSTRKQGIRYIVQVTEGYAGSLRKAVAAYLPEVRTKIVGDYLPVNPRGALIELKQARHFAFPLAQQDKLNDHDPIAYLTTAMTKLEAGELMAMQVVVVPSRSRHAMDVHNRIIAGRELYLHDGFIHYMFLLTIRTIELAFKIVGSIINFIAAIVGADTGQGQPERRQTRHQERLQDSMLEKLAQPLLHTTIRLYVSAINANERMTELQTVLSSLQTPGYQGLVILRSFPRFIRMRYRRLKFKQRMPSMLPEWSPLLAASEVAGLYHFPYADAAKTENLVKSHSRTLPAPVAVKTNADNDVFDIRIGLNNHHGSGTDIGLTAAERERHVFVVGGTGNGKTTMLLGAMIQDTSKGNGFAFIDPHGDAAEALISHVPEDRIKDVVYFNPDDLGHPIGLNLLELREGLTDDELLREKDLVTEATISVFRKIFSEEDEGGHRIEYVLRNAVQTALTQPGATLFTVFDLLNDPAYRKQVVSKLQDKDLKNFWQHELGKAGNFQRVKMAAGITAKIGRFLFSASAKRILEQPKSTIDFDDIMNSGKILVCNFSKGLLGEDTSELFGITVLAKLQMAALRRARIKQEDRQPFYLYVDEFQNFATTSFVQLLSEARKYRLYMTLAEQSTSQQQDQRMVQIILANVGTLVCFRTANPADEKLLLPFFAPYIDTGEIANLPAFNFYMRIAGLKTQEPFSGETVLPPEEGSAEVVHRVIDHSRSTYAGSPTPKEQPKTGIEPQATEPSSKPANRRPQKKHKAAI